MTGSEEPYVPDIESRDDFDNDPEVRLRALTRE